MSKQSVSVAFPYIEGHSPTLIIGEQSYDLDELSGSYLRALVREDQAEQIETDLAEWRNRRFPDPDALSVQQELA